MTLRNWQRLKIDPAYRARMEERSRIVNAVRAFFASEGFLEVETPTVVALPGMEPHLEPLRTEVLRHDGASFKAHLITSPEYAMKKLLAGGLTKIFELARAYRNGEPWDGGHNPEFTMLEWYRADADYTAIMDDTERLVASAAQAVYGGEVIEYQGRKIDLAAPWPRMTVAEAMRDYAGIDLNRAIDDPAWFRTEAAAMGIEPQPEDTWDDIFFKIFLRDVEPRLAVPGTKGAVRPVILYEYPRSMAALARLKPGDTRYAERFEAYIGGMELANAFSELNDAPEQRRRLEEERAERARLGKSDHGTDEQFLEAVAQMPPSAGIALGIDRLVMLLTDAPTIRDVLYFPAQDLFE
jgi:elongation factor P--(R)-beta-lysine ligase